MIQKSVLLSSWFKTQFSYHHDSKLSSLIIMIQNSVLLSSWFKNMFSYHHDSKLCPIIIMIQNSILLSSYFQTLFSDHHIFKLCPLTNLVSNSFASISRISYECCYLFPTLPCILRLLTQFSLIYNFRLLFYSHFVITTIIGTSF